MESAYPSRPDGVPSDLARPSKAFRRHAWLAGLALVAFVVLYVGFAAWLGVVAWRLLATALRPGGDAANFFLSLAPLFLLAFLVKGVFFVKRGTLGPSIEVTPDDEPQLYAFIRRIADETGSPRPHRVFLTPEVNASVFYDISVRNLIWPTRKNLNVGLGLVNVLTLDELKAVLAHEFGHFAQRTMALGTWVYIGQQALGAVVARRDAFDKFLDGLSRFDIRIAWIGWAMRLIVWAIRAAIDTAFRGVVVLQRALSREMEFQADLVSVSLCGSDSLVHALRRLGPADDALGRAAAFAARESRAGRPVADVYGLQAAVLEHLRRVWQDPLLGDVPPVPGDRPAAHRVFTRAIADVPRMWATHPPSRDREERAKSTYVASVLDPRSSWILFRDAEATRRRMTELISGKSSSDAARAAPVPRDESARRLSAAFDRPSFDPRWRGIYVGRSVVRGARRHRDLFGDLPEGAPAIASALEALYPPSLVDLLREWRDAEAEAAQLDALAEGVLEAPGGVIRFRGRVIPRSELSRALREAREERDRLRGALVSHDRDVRAAHYAAAKALGGGWELYLVGLAGLLHYFEHAVANLADAEGVVRNVFRMATAGGRVSRSDGTRIVNACNEMFRALARVYEDAPGVRLPQPVTARLGAESWKGALGEDLRLTPATLAALGVNWLEAASTWVTHAEGCLEAAAGATLDALLEAESHVALCFRERTEPGTPPELPQVPNAYATLVPGEERRRQRRLGWWERFQLADGWLPGVARLGVAAAILGPALWAAWDVGGVTIKVHNGLGIPVLVDVGGARRLEVPAGETRDVTMSPSWRVTVEAGTTDGRSIERFRTAASDPGATYVYNVAGADVLVTVSVGYGTDQVPAPVVVGRPRWSEARADFVLGEAPRSMRSDAATVRKWLAPMSSAPISSRLSACPDDERAALAGTHVRWDPVTSPGLTSWARAAAGLGVDIVPVLRERPEWAAGDLTLRRIRQDVQRAAACADDIAAARARPEDADAVYLALRCSDDEGTEFRAAAARFPDHPWIGWGLAWEQMRDREWASAASTLERVAPNLPALRDEVASMRLRALRMTGASVEEQFVAIQLLPDYPSWVVLLGADAGTPRGTEASLDRWDAVVAARARGDIAEAVRRTASIRSHHDEWHVWMNAASEGATRDQVEAAFALPREGGLDSNSVWVALALEAREGRDRSSTEVLAKRVSPGRLALLQPILASRTPPEVERAVDAAARGAGAGDLGWIWLTGVIRLGDAAPEAWRSGARALLLPWERPYLRAARKR